MASFTGAVSVVQTSGNGFEGSCKDRYSNFLTSERIAERILSIPNCIMSKGMTVNPMERKVPDAASFSPVCSIAEIQYIYTSVQKYGEIQTLR
jgi:hypothetical protein